MSRTLTEGDETHGPHSLADRRRRRRIRHQLGKTDQGKQFFRTLDEKTTEFSKAVTDQYKAREADLKAAIANVEEAITEFSAKAR